MKSFNSSSVLLFLWYLYVFEYPVHSEIVDLLLSVVKWGLQNKVRILPCWIHVSTSHLVHNVFHGYMEAISFKLISIWFSGATRAWGPFLEAPGNLTGPKSYFKIKVSRKVGCVLTSNEVHFVSLADGFTVQFLNLLKLPSGMENKTA